MVRMLSVTLTVAAFAAAASQANEPQWTPWKRVKEFRQERLGKTLNDIESHIQTNHAYRFPSMPMTWAHETTHGINANIRNRFFGGKPVRTGFYCLDDRCVLIDEPVGTRLSRFVSKIPAVLRGPSYDLYLRQQLRYWDSHPLYILDEWVAYTNGTACGQEVKEDGWFYELLQAHNFCVYAIFMAKQIEEDCPDYDQTQLKAFIVWNTQRVFRYTEMAKEDPTNRLDRVKKYLRAFRESPDAKPIRDFARRYLGEHTCKNLYGF